MPAPSGFVIMCSRGGRNSGGPCVGCKRMAGAYLLCDYPVLRDGRETTCDRRICRSCALSIGPDRDLCPAHKELWDFERGVPKVGPQAAPPLKPFVEPALSPEPAAPTAPGLDAVEGLGQAEGSAGRRRPLRSTHTGGSSTDDDIVDRLQQLELPDEP